MLSDYGMTKWQTYLASPYNSLRGEGALSQESTSLKLTRGNTSVIDQASKIYERVSFYSYVADVLYHSHNFDCDGAYMCVCVYNQHYLYVICMHILYMYDSLHLTDGAQIILSFSPTVQKIKEKCWKHTLSE